MIQEVPDVLWLDFTVMIRMIHFQEKSDLCDTPDSEGRQRAENRVLSCEFMGWGWVSLMLDVLGVWYDIQRAGDADRKKKTKLQTG